jgi:uncharacterized protein
MHALRPFCLAAVIGLAGCGGLSRGAAPQQHFVLGGGLLTPSEATPRDLAGVAVGVRRLQVAPYLESTSIVVRHGDQEVTFAEFQRWGEPLGDGIGRTLAGYLAAGAPFRAVDVAPWPLREEYDYLVQLHVVRFEGVAPAASDPAGPSAEVPGGAHLLVRWEILRQRDGAVLARGTTDYRPEGWRVGDYPALVTLLDRGVRVLSDDLMARLQILRPSSNEPG